jgi:Mg/Co/Ni transporter MgtE
LFSRNSVDQVDILLGLPEDERRAWMRLLAPDDAADLVQVAPPETREHLLALLDEPTRDEVRGLLAFAEDRAGGLMNTRFSRLRPGCRSMRQSRTCANQTGEGRDDLPFQRSDLPNNTAWARFCCDLFDASAGVHVAT